MNEELKEEINDEHHARLSAGENCQQKENGQVECKHQNTHIQRYVAKPPIRQKGADDRGKTRHASGCETVIVGKVVQRSGNEERREETNEDIHQQNLCIFAYIFRFHLIHGALFFGFFFFFIFGFKHKTFSVFCSHTMIILFLKEDKQMNVEITKKIKNFVKAREKEKKTIFSAE